PAPSAEGLDAPARQIPHPALHAFDLGGLDGVEPEAYTLHAATHYEAAGNEHPESMAENLGTPGPRNRQSIVPALLHDNRLQSTLRRHRVERGDVRLQRRPRAQESLVG